MMYKSLSKRIEYSQNSFREGRNVLKGTSKRVIVVKSPDRQFFEEAIFIVRDELLSSNGLTKDKLLSEAIKAADGCVIGSGAGAKKRIWLIVLLTSLCSSGVLLVVMRLIGA